MKILLIEPDEYYHQLFQNLLGEEGNLLTCRSATEAQSALAEALPDAVIMELLLPEGTGYELLRYLQEFREEHGFPVIIFTRVDHWEDIERSLNFGVTGYFVKGQDSIYDIKNLLFTLTQT